MHCHGDFGRVCNGLHIQGYILHIITAMRRQINDGSGVELIHTVMECPWFARIHRMLPASALVASGSCSSVNRIFLSSFTIFPSPSTSSWDFSFLLSNLLQPRSHQLQYLSQFVSCVPKAGDERWRASKKSDLQGPRREQHRLVS